MWERMFDLVLGLKKEHRLMMVITLIYAVTLFGITVDVEAMENWLQLVGYTIRTLCIACISFSENLDSLILEEKKTLIRVIKEIDLKQFKIEEKQKRYEKPLVSILFLLQIFGFYILILYSSYFDRTNKVNRVIAVENIPDRKKVRSYFCDKVLKPLVLLLSVFLWGFLFFLWLR